MLASAHARFSFSLHLPFSLSLTRALHIYARRRPARKKSLCARLLSSLPHYSIMMACGVCHTPSALPSQCRPLSPRPAPSFFFFFLSPSLLLLLLLAPCPSLCSSVPSSPPFLSFSFIRRPILVHPPLASFVPRHRRRDTRTHLRDDDVRDITRRSTWSRGQREKEGYEEKERETKRGRRRKRREKGGGGRKRDGERMLRKEEKRKGARATRRRERWNGGRKEDRE